MKLYIEDKSGVLFLAAEAIDEADLTDMAVCSDIMRDIRSARRTAQIYNKEKEQVEND